MLKRVAALLTVGLIAVFAVAKDKKPILPAFVLSARTVSVIIEPGAGMSIEDPRANQVAQKDVETALLNWGRFQTTMSTQAADLIIVVRKGSGHAVDETLPDTRQNNRIGQINPIDNGIGVGAQTTGPRGDASTQRPTTPQMEIGGSGDSFLVYDGAIPDPLDSPPVWRYMAKDGLMPHSVPAVAAFRKAISDAEKAAGKKP